MAWNKVQVRDALKEVRRRLAAHPDGKRLALSVPKDGYSVHGEWLSVLVDPGVENVRAYDYVEALGNVEKELEAHGLTHVTLLPALVR